MTDHIIAWSSAAVAFFAIVQVLLAWSDRRDRARAAFHIVHSEWMRLLLVVGRWQQEDLVKLADAQVLDPTELLPPNVAHFGAGLTSLGHATATFGAAAINVISGAVRNCKLLQTLAARVPPSSRTEVQAEALTDLERKIKDALGQGLLLLEDALEVAPPWLRHEPFDLGEPKSDLGKRLVAEIRKVPLSRFGRFRRAVASLLHAIARRLDAAPIPRMSNREHG
jgi:hypothetical protein